MSMKRAVRAAAIAATISMSGLTLSAGPAFADPSQPPCPNCNGGGHPGGGGPNSGPSHEPQSPAPQSHEPPSPQSSAPPSPQSSAPPSPQSHEPPSPQSSAPGAPSSGPPNSHGPESSAPPGAPSETPPSDRNSPPSSAPSASPSGEPSRKPLAAPSTQPPHPPYTPHGAYLSGNADVGGPTDAHAGFSIVGHGAPPPPPEHAHGWNDGPAPGGPPPNWQGPPPQGGWGGPPPPGGWNRHWDNPGPPRDVVVAQADFGPFQYNTYMVIPTFNWQFGGWGYWYFGVWIPLY
jgi:hypothetical protein